MGRRTLDPLGMGAPLIDPFVQFQPAVAAPVAPVAAATTPRAVAAAAVPQPVPQSVAAVQAAAPYVPAPFGRGGAGDRTAELLRSLAMNQFAREQVGRVQATALDDMGRRFGDLRRQISGGMNRRGMLDSGQRDRAWRRSYADEVRDVGRLGDAFDSQRFQYDLGDFGAEGTYANSGLAALQNDVERRAAAAADIRAARV